MIRFALFLFAGVLAGSVGLDVQPAAARYESGGSRIDHSHSPHPHRHARRHSQRLPPEIAYRDPRVDLRKRGRPDFLIRGYQPRLTERPIYNEPPPRFLGR